MTTTTTKSKTRVCHAAYFAIQRAHEACIVLPSRSCRVYHAAILRVQKDSFTCLLAPPHPPRSLALHVYIMNIYRRPPVPRCDKNTCRFHGIMYLAADFDLMTRWYLEARSEFYVYTSGEGNNVDDHKVTFRARARKGEVARRSRKISLTDATTRSLIRVIYPPSRRLHNIAYRAIEPCAIYRIGILFQGAAPRL